MLVRIIAVAATAATLLMGCAAPIQRFGIAAPSGASLADARFTMAAAPNGHDRDHARVADAVRKALLQRGYQEVADGPLRVEVALAVAPVSVGVALPNTDETKIDSRSKWPTLGLCKRQRYVLSVAIIGRATGNVVSRASASLKRCRDGVDEMLPALAAAALDI